MKINLKPPKKLISKKRILALLAVAGVVIAGTVGKLDDIPPINDIKEPEQIVEVADLPPEPDAPMDLGVQSEEDEDEEKKLPFFASIKKRFLQLPAAVRMMLTLPVYAAAWCFKIVLLALLKVAGAAVAPFVGPVLGALAVLVSVLAGLKLAFPEVPMKELVTNKDCWLILIVSLATYVGAFYLVRFMNTESTLEEILMLLAMLLAGCTMLGLLVKRYSEKQKKEA